MASDLDPVGWILQQSHRYPLLTAAQEIEYARKVQAWLAVKDKPEPTAQERRLIRRGKRAYENFFLCNIRLVVQVASRYTRIAGTLALEDLVQEGLVGLERAIVKFDPTRGYKFSTYAYNWIRQGITRSISNKSRTIRVPAHGIDLLRRASDYMRDQQLLHNRVPTLDEVAEHCGTKLPTLRNYLMHNSSTISLDEQVQTKNKNPDASCYMDLIAAEANEPGFLDEQEDLLAALDQAMDSLTAKQRQVIELRFDADAKYSFSEIARMVGKSRQSTQTCHKEGMKRLRRRLLSNRPVPLGIQAQQSAA